MRRWVPVLAAGGAAVFLSRAVFGELDLEAIPLLVEAFWPALLFTAFLLLALWAVRAGGARVAEGPWARLALGAGAAAFLLHNLTDFSLWTPGMALAFWTAAGMGLALAGDGERASGGAPPPGSGRGPRIAGIAAAGPVAVSVSVLAAVAAAAVILWRPVLLRTVHMQEAADRLHRHDPAGAADAAGRAARADPLDDLAADDAARLFAARAASGGAAGEAMDRAQAWAREAIRRNPRSSSHERLAGSIAWRAGPGPARAEALAHLRRAVALDPAEARLRIEFARMLCEAGEFPECLRELAAAEGLDRRLTEFSRRYQSPEDRARGEPPSKMVLDEREWAEIDRLRARARDAVMGEKRRP